MHLKYRPQSFDEVIGNKALIKSLKEIQLGRPIMFEGSRGLGKTTFAYILAKEFGASENNITDVNCVYFSKIEDMRERLDTLSKSSLFGKEKVLILDEIHELSPKTQNVLLKPLEDLPKNILVLACTTTTKKVVGTLLDRFIRYRVNPLSVRDSKTLIDSVCKKEGIFLKKSFKVLLIEKSDGNPRRLLTGLAKIRNAEDEKEAKYLLDLDFVEGFEDALEVLKFVLSKISWGAIAKRLKEALKEVKPESIRLGMMNLIANRILLNYHKSVVEGEKLVQMYSILNSYQGNLDKANLIIALYQMCEIMNK